MMLGSRGHAAAAGPAPLAVGRGRDRAGDADSGSRSCSACSLRSDRAGAASSRGACWRGVAARWPGSPPVGWSRSWLTVAGFWARRRSWTPSSRGSGRSIATHTDQTGAFVQARPCARRSSRVGLGWTVVPSCSGPSCPSAWVWPSFWTRRRELTAWGTHVCDGWPEGGDGLDRPLNGAASRSTGTHGLAALPAGGARASVAASAPWPTWWRRAGSEVPRRLLVGAVAVLGRSSAPWTSTFLSSGSGGTAPTGSTASGTLADGGVQPPAGRRHRVSASRRRSRSCWQSQEEHQPVPPVRPRDARLRRRPVALRRPRLRRLADRAAARRAVRPRPPPARLPAAPDEHLRQGRAAHRGGAGAPNGAPTSATTSTRRWWPRSRKT